MEFRVLGPLELVEDDRPVRVAGARQRALLALLLIRANELVSSDWLIEELWRERPPADAQNALQAAVSRLRRALNGDRRDNGRGVRVVTRAPGYVLEVNPELIDARRFEQMAREGRDALSDGDPRYASAVLQDALALWRGAPFADFVYEPFAQHEIARLEELRLSAVEDRIDADLERGRELEVVPELEDLTARYPFRERLRGQLMLALYRCGRQADALKAYQDTRGALVEELGIEPGAYLRELERAILSQDPALAVSALDRVELPPALHTGSPLAGRQAELDWLREHWRRARAGAGRLVLLVGVSGIGKTRLSAELAKEVLREQGGVLYASGAGAPEPARGVVEKASAPGRPTLVVLEEVDLANEELLAAVRELAQGSTALPLLAVATAEDSAIAPALDAAATLALAPLDAEAVRLVTQHYAGPRASAKIPTELIAAASRGVPQRVHRAAREWARGEAMRRLGTAAGRAASERADLRAAEDDVAGDVVELQALREPAEPKAGGRDAVACPFKGLASFELEDAHLFFGRERLVAEMVARVAGAPLMGIVGSSGSGKSSALRGGLLAELAAGVLPGSEEWALALGRPGEHPRRALERATAGNAAPGKLVLAVDQFEEVFTACREERERAAFVDLLVKAARDPRRPALVLVAIRADFYGRCSTYPELSRLLAANHVPVGPMRRDELRRAIEQPARWAGVGVDPEVVAGLIADVEGEPGGLPLLSTSLVELWERRDGRGLQLSAYEQAGGVRGAVARLAESAYGRLEPAEQDIARRILLRLAGEGEAVVRRRVELAELDADRDEAVARVLASLARDRLVTIGEGEVEVAHEALLREWPRLRGWLEEDVAGRRLHRHLRSSAKQWETGGRDSGELYRGARLASALDWASDHDVDLNEIERAFLDDSRAASGRAQRRLRAGLAALAVLLVLAVVAGLVALDERDKARDEAVGADAQRLGALALLEDDLDRALLLARQGVALNDTVQTRSNLLAALLKSPAAIGVIRADSGDIEWTALSPDGRTLAAGNSPGRVLLFDTRTRERVATLKLTPRDAAIYDLAYSPDGNRLAVFHVDHPNTSDPRWQITVLEVDGGRRVARLTFPGRDVSGVQFSPDGRAVAVMTISASDGAAAVMRFDADTGRRIFGPFRVSRGWSPLLRTSDGRRIVVPDDDEVTLRDATTLAVLRRIPVVGLNPSPDQGDRYALSSDGHTLAIGDHSGAVRLLDLRNGSTRNASGGHEGAVRDARFAPDGRRLITTGEDGDVVVWNVQRASATETLRGHAGAVFAPQITPDGTTLFTSSEDGTAFVWDLDGARRLGRPFRVGAGTVGQSHAFSTIGPMLSSDGRLLARGRNDGTLSVADIDAQKPRAPVKVARSGWVWGIGFVPGSHLFMVGGQNGLVAVVDADRGAVIRRLRADRRDISGGSIDRSGRLMATFSEKAVRLWSLPEERPLGAPLRYPSVAMIGDMQLSPDGRRIAITLLDQLVVGGGETLEVRDVRSRRVLASRRINGLSLIKFSPDSRLLAVADIDGRVRLWSTETWEPVSGWLASSNNDVHGLAIGRDGRTLATGSVDGTVRLWDIETEQAIGAPLPGRPNRPVRPLFTPDGLVAPLFTPDGSQLLAIYESGHAYRWDIRPGSLARQACRVAERRLTRSEWKEILPSREYDPAC